MASNAERVRENYASGREDTRAEWCRASGLEFHYTKKLLSPYIREDTRAIELGCATGYYGLHFAPRCKSWHGVDLSPENIGLFLGHIEKPGLENLSCEVGDATDLKKFGDMGFDLVLNLGPMYHLPPEERETSFRECFRITKAGGTAAFAYISPLGAYLKGLLMAPERYPNKIANAFLLGRGRDDLRPELFFFSSPEEMADMARGAGFRVLKNLGTDYTFHDGLINGMDEEKFEAYTELCDKMVESESCAGLANHGLLICEKGCGPELEKSEHTEAEA